MYHSKTMFWENSHRDYLVRWANELTDTVAVMPSNTSESQPLQSLREMRRSRLNPAILDVAFGGDPVLCAPDTCKLMREIYPFRPIQGRGREGQHKYIIDVDGNGWSGRFKRLMTSNALVFKSTIYPEWFADRVQPWVHYVPVQVDLSDLYDTLIFFRGDPNGEGHHEDLARTIALAGRRWSKVFWRKEDLTAYFFRLILEYARVMSVDRDKMSFALE